MGLAGLTNGDFQPPTMASRFNIYSVSRIYIYQ